MKTSKIMIVLALLVCTAAYAQPRQEYPRPQFERHDWINLNGEWTYALDQVLSGLEKGYAESEGFDGRIIVPFCPESKLSGVEYTDFINSIWYQRTIEIPASWEGRDIIINFGAVYYLSEVYIDGTFIGRHFGGSDSFAFDITGAVSPGKKHSLVIRACSDLRSRMQPAGKQSLRSENFECMYTRTTGIWQTVWLEAVNHFGLSSVKTVTDIDNGTVSFHPDYRNIMAGEMLRITILDNGKKVNSALVAAAQGSVVPIPVKKAKLWSPDSPFLYDVVYEVLDKEGNVLDTASSYFGMRKIHTEGNVIYLNNEPFYQRLVLDQGFYPDGIWTAPSDEALKHDIEMSKAVGFNGARLHQKVFEERFHYWADRLGYITWGEFPSWGLDANDPVAARNFLTEWANVVRRDLNHPSIVTWTAMNEEFWPDEMQYPRFVTDLYDLTKAIDPTRPINTVSGGVHIKTDIWTEHNYEQDAEKLRDILYSNGKLYTRKAVSILARESGNVGYNRPIVNDDFILPDYNAGMPYILDEFGGIKCMETNPVKDGAWGYGSSPATKEDFYQRLESQVSMLMELSDHIWGYCYTQLTDVMQEQNGIYYFDRRAKYDAERLRAIFGMPVPSKGK